MRYQPRCSTTPATAPMAILLARAAVLFGCTLTGIVIARIAGIPL